MMNMRIEVSGVKKKINLPGGGLVLLDRLAKEDVYGKVECARNIYLVDSSGEVIWQVKTAFDEDGGSFTNISVDKDGIKGYRWDGGIYEIDLESGMGVPILLVR